MRNIWNRESILEFINQHPEIISRNTLEKASQSVYKAALRLNMLNELFGNRLKERNVWSPEKVLEYMKEHPEIKSRNMLKKASEEIYNAAYRFNLMDMLFQKIERWNIDKLSKLIETNNIKNRLELKEISETAYNYANRKKLFEYFFGEDNNYIIDNNYRGFCVYIYKVEQYHAIYVGLTSNPLQRDRQHLTPNKNGKYDSLGNFCKEHNVPIPTMEIIKDKLSPKQASEYETQLWYEYKQAGWFMINCKSALGSLGGNYISKSKKWTKENISKYLKNHPDIKTKDDLKKYNPKAYNDALTGNFLDILFKQYVKYNEEDVIQYLFEHPNIKSKTALYKTNKDVFYAAKEMQMLNELFKPVKHEKYTNDDLMLYISEHPEIKTKTMFAKQNPSLYKFALESGLINEMNFEKISRRKWTKEAIYKLLSEHPEIKTRNQFRQCFSGAYHSANELQIINELFEKRSRRLSIWSKNAIYNLLREHPEIKTRNDLFKYNSGCYASAYKMGLLNELFGDKKHKETKWTKQSIINFMSEHPEIKTRNDLRNINQSCYITAYKLKLIDKLFGSSISWTEETIKQYLFKHPEIKTKTMFAKQNPSAYQKALKLNIINELFK